MNEFQLKQYIKERGEKIILGLWKGHAITHDRDILILIEYDSRIASRNALKELKEFFESQKAD
jgi:hypothetical protein